MKQCELNRLRVTSWHEMIDSGIIEIKGNTLITGASGSGKSTIIDAILATLFVSPNLMNKAANEKSSRDIKSYVRCKRSDGTYKRNGAVYSYVIFEIKTYNDGKFLYSSLIGACYSSPSATQPVKSNFFVIKNATLDDVDLFYTKDGVEYSKPWNQFLEDVIEAGFDDIKHKDTQKAAEEMFAGILGVSSVDEFKRMQEICGLSTAYKAKSIGQPNAFIRECVFSREDCSIQNVINATNHYKNLDKSLQQIVERIKLCEDILDKQAAQRKLQLEIDNNIAIERVITYNILKKQLYEINNILDSINNQYNVIQLDLTTAKQIQRQAEKDKIRLESQNDTAITIEQSKEKLIELRRTLETAKRKFEDYIRALHTVKSDIKSLSIDIEISDELNVDNIVKAINIAAQNYKTKLAEATIKHASVRQQINTLTNEINALDAGKPIGYALDKALKLIKSEFDKKGIDDTPILLYSAIEFKSEWKGWQKTIEAFLSRTRFAIIVKPINFVEATNIIKKNNIHNVTIIDTTKIENYVVKENSVAACFTYSNEYAEKYMAYKYNSFIPTVDVLDNNVTAELRIDNTGALYRSKSFTLHDTNSVDLFIGRDAIVNQIKTKEKEREALYQERSSIEAQLKAIDEYSQHVNVLNEKMLILNNNNVLYNLEHIPKQIAELEEVIARLSQNQDFLTIQDEIKRLEDKIAQCDNQINALEQNATDLMKQIGSQEAKREDAQTAFDSCSLSLEHIKKSNIASYEAAIKEFDELMADKRRSIESISKNSTVKKLEQEKAINEGKLMEIKKKYINDYNLAIDFTGDDSYRAFENEYHKINDDKYPMLQKQVNEAKIEQIVILQNEIIHKIHIYYNRITQDINRINKMLRNAYENGTAGGDGKLYKLTKVTLIDGFERFESLIKNYNNDAIVNGQISMLADVNDFELENDFINALRALPSFDDCRQLFKLDLVWYLPTTLDKTGKPDGSFTNNMATNSGGEIQTPFYILLAIALLDNNPSFKILLADEAFSTMDEISIRNTMAFFDVLGFQSFISIPDSKNDIMVDCVQNAYSMVNSQSGRGLIREKIDNRKLVGFYEVKNDENDSE